MIEGALSLNYTGQGAWGVHGVDVTCGLQLSEDDYNLVVQYTATTD